MSAASSDMSVREWLRRTFRTVAVVFWGSASMSAAIRVAVSEAAIITYPPMPGVYLPCRAALVSIARR